MCVCVDFRDLNVATTEDKYPMLVVNMLVNSIAGILRLLVEIYSMPNLKMNLMFDIEVSFFFLLAGVSLA